MSTKPLIWIDITDPKYALFFTSFMERLSCYEYFVTARGGEGYSEVIAILKQSGVPYEAVGAYGGASRHAKLRARIAREAGLLKAVENKEGRHKEIDLFISGASVEGTHVAFGLGKKIASFSDTPALAGESALTVVSSLMLPLSDIAFIPFVLSSALYHESYPKLEVVSYGFIDPVLYLPELNCEDSEAIKQEMNSTKTKSKPSEANKSHLDSTKTASKQPPSLRSLLGLKERYIVLVREEEYKAHYVKERSPAIYEAVRLLSGLGDAAAVIIPRYGVCDRLRALLALPHVYLLERPLPPRVLYSSVDALVGGGGTMNLEACYYSIPTLSLRSITLVHDNYLCQLGLMHKSIDVKEGIAWLLDTLASKNALPSLAKDAYIARGCTLSGELDKLRQAIDALLARG